MRLKIISFAIVSALLLLSYDVAASSRSITSKTKKHSPARALRFYNDTSCCTGRTLLVVSAWGMGLVNQMILFASATYYGVLTRRNVCLLGYNTEFWRKNESSQKMSSVTVSDVFDVVAINKALKLLHKNVTFSNHKTRVCGLNYDTKLLNPTTFISFDDDSSHSADLNWARNLQFSQHRLNRIKSGGNASSVFLSDLEQFANVSSVSILNRWRIFSSAPIFYDNHIESKLNFMVWRSVWNSFSFLPCYKVAVDTYFRTHLAELSGSNYTSFHLRAEDDWLELAEKHTRQIQSMYFLHRVVCALKQRVSADVNLVVVSGLRRYGYTDTCPRLFFATEYVSRYFRVFTPDKEAIFHSCSCAVTGDSGVLSSGILAIFDFLIASGGNKFAHVSDSFSAFATAVSDRMGNKKNVIELRYQLCLGSLSGFKASASLREMIEIANHSRIVLAKDGSLCRLSSNLNERILDINSFTETTVESKNDDE